MISLYFFYVTFLKYLCVRNYGKKQSFVENLIEIQGDSGSGLFKVTSPIIENPALVCLYKNGLLDSFKVNTLSDFTKNYNHKINSGDDFLIREINRRGVFTSKSPKMINYKVDDFNNRVKYVEDSKKELLLSDFAQSVRRKALEKLIFIQKQNKRVAKDVKLTKISNFDYEVDITFTDFTREKVSLINDFIWILPDEGFNKHKFFWDDMFIAWFIMDTDPMISRSVMSFWYSMQYQDGLIPREIRLESLPIIKKSDHFSSEINGVSFIPTSSLSVNNPFLLSQLEIEWYKKFKTDEYIVENLDKLQKYFFWLEKNRKSSLSVEGNNVNFYEWSDQGSGMDNMQRCDGACGYLDLISQQALLSKDIEKMALIVGDVELSSEFRERYEEMKNNINSFYYNKSTNFYYDFNIEIKSTEGLQNATFLWVLLAEIPSNEVAELIVNNYLLNKDKFYSEFFITSISRDNVYYESNNYWRGGVWPPLSWLGYLVLKNSESYEQIASEIALKLYCQFKESYRLYGTLYEYYDSNDSFSTLNPGSNPPAKEDFYGWSILPLKLEIELLSNIENKPDQLVEFCSKP